LPYDGQKPGVAQSTGSRPTGWNPRNCSARTLHRVQWAVGNR
jgi:hypothetical protein